MGRALESSVILQFTRRVASGSLVWRGLAATGRNVLGVFTFAITLVRYTDAAFARARAAGPDVDDETRVKAVLVESRLVRWVDRALDVPQRAWASSAARRWLAPVVSDFRTQSSPEQVRLVGWMLVVAGLTHIALMLLFAEPVGWPTMVAWATYLTVSCVPVICSSGVVAAWANRPPWVRRLLREPEPWQ